MRNWQIAFNKWRNGFGTDQEKSIFVQELIKIVAAKVF